MPESILIYNYYIDTVLNKYQDAYLQDYYQMTISYEEGQTISFCEKDDIICEEDFSYRKGITIDHPFVIWLLENAFLLNQYFQRQFQQIVDCLRRYSGENMVQECNHIRQQLMSLSEHHGVA